MRTKFLTAIAGMIVAATVSAAGQQVPHSFQAGKKAVASEVNENFQDLADRIDDLSVRVDGLPGGTVLNASDFAQANTITGKSFQISFNSLGCTADNRTYATNTVGDTTTIVETVVATSNGGATPCAYVKNTLERNPTALRVAQIDQYTPDGMSLVDTITFTPPLLYLPAQLSKGGIWSGEAVFGHTNGAPPTLFLAQYTLIGLEDVTVPAGPFTNCLKTVRTASNSVDRVEWRCAGVGLVKRIDISGNPASSGISELVSVTP